jgi:hypothetical protein
LPIFCRDDLATGSVCIEKACWCETEVPWRALATPSKELHDMAKKRTAAKKRGTPRKPQARRRRENPDANINTLVILVVIVMVLGGLFLYAQNNKKQAAQWQAILQTIAALPAPAPTALLDEPQAIESTASIDAVKDPLKPAAAMAVVRPPSSNE